MKKVLAMLVVAGITTGCAVMPANKKYNSVIHDSPYLIGGEQKQIPGCEPLSREQELAISLSKEMISSRRLHAALANLERLPGQLPEARLGKAQILRLLKRPEAEQLYQSLIDTCLVADGYHGMAQMAVLNEDNEAALDLMQKAVAYEPTNENMRNDLGVIYMNLRKLDEARFELLTAAELNEEKTRAMLNLLTLTLYQENFDAAAKLASRYRINTRQYESALNKAHNMHKQDETSKNTNVKSRPVAKVASPQINDQNESVSEKKTANISEVRLVKGVQRTDSVSRPIVPMSLQ